MMSKNLSFLAHLLIQKQTTVPSHRLYSRWMNRTPAKVTLPFEPTAKPNLKKEKVISLDPEILTKNKETKSGAQSAKLDLKVETEVSKNNLKKKYTHVKSEREEKIRKRQFYLSQKKVFDDNHEVLYEKLKENDGRVSSLLVKLKSKKDRQRSGQILVEGWRLIVDGLEAKCKLKYVIFSQTEDLNKLRPFLPKTGVMLYKVSYKEIEMWSDVETSSGIFGIFEIPTPEDVKRLSKPLPLHFICDNIRTPGNLGAILRVAVGAGCEKVVLTKGCVDLWDPKVIRSAAGAHFRLPIHNSIEWEEIPKHLNEDTSILIADSNAKVMFDDQGDVEIVDNQQVAPMPVVPYYGAQFSAMKHITLIIGGETEGISHESYELAAKNNGLKLNIPLQKGVDSLNTGMATAIIAFEIRKQLIEALAKAKLQRRAVHFSIFEIPTPEDVKRLSKPLPLHFICDNIRTPGNLGAILRVAVGAGCEKVVLTKGCVDLWDPKVIRSAAGAHFRLPIHNSIEWEEIPKHLNEDTSILIADSNAKVMFDDQGDVEIVDNQQVAPMPVVPYYGAQFSAMKHITLIIGGETEGISHESYELAAKNNGLKLNIPLQKGVDSLNTGMATAIIAFEIRKQLIEALAKAKLQRRAVHFS